MINVLRLIQIVVACVYFVMLLADILRDVKDKRT